MEEQLCLETELSKKPTLLLNDPTALTEKQQLALNQHKVSVEVYLAMDSGTYSFIDGK